MPDARAYLGPILVTLVYFGAYYASQIYILTVKSKLSRAYDQRGEKFDRYFGQDRQMLAADRIQLNMLEHMGPFVVLLWLNAAFVGTGGATVAGAIYVAARMLYPFVLGSRLGRGIRARILFATLPGYVVITYFCVRLAVAVL